MSICRCIGGSGLSSSLRWGGCLRDKLPFIPAAVGEGSRVLALMSSSSWLPFSNFVQQLLDNLKEGSIMVVPRVSHGRRHWPWLWWWNSSSTNLQRHSNAQVKSEKLNKSSWNLLEFITWHCGGLLFVRWSTCLFFSIDRWHFYLFLCRSRDFP